jgi:predicted nucleic acid-binding protein
VLTLDTSGILAALDWRDPHHAETVYALRQEGGRLVVPVGIMSEIAYMTEARLGARVLDEFLGDLEEGAFVPDCGEDDLLRIRALIARYRDLGLGYGDANVIACAERNGGRVLTYDFRHFLAVAREGGIAVVGFEES